jgi:hypothetical protein
MGVTRYNIIRLQVDRPRQIIRFQHKVPTYLKRCTGFKAVHVRGIGTDLYVPEIGWFTASFNSLKEEAIVTPVSAQAFYEPEETHEFQTLDVHLLQGQLVVGVYLDTCPSNLFAPYIVSLYLRCTDSNEIKQVTSNNPVLPIEQNVQPDAKEDETEDCSCPNPMDEDDEYEEESNPDQLCSII